MLAYGSFATSLLLPEGGRVGTFLVCSCKSIRDEFACLYACVWFKKKDSKPLPYRYLVTQTLDQSTWQRREQRRLQLKPQPQRRRLLSRQAWICSSQILLACFFKFCICSSQHFSYTTLWMQPSGLSHLRLFSTETGVRYFAKSFVLCAEGHRHPRQGWMAAIRKKDLTFFEPPEENRLNITQMWPGVSFFALPT